MIVDFVCLFGNVYALIFFLILKNKVNIGFGNKKQDDNSLDLKKSKNDNLQLIEKNSDNQN